MMSPSTNRTQVAERANDLTVLSDIVGAFMATPRSTMRYGRCETDGEHTLHLQFIAVAYAAKHHPELDAARVALYAMVHDLVEVYAGDINSLTTTNDMMAQKELNERRAFERLKREIRELWPSLIELICDYEAQVDSEARFVKCFDKCDPAFTHLKDGGQALRQMGIEDSDHLWLLNKATEQRMVSYSGEFPDIVELRRELHQRVAANTFPRA